MSGTVKVKVNQVKQDLKKKGSNYKLVKKNVSDYMYFLSQLVKLQSMNQQQNF
jgi:hypothetical protein